MYDWLKLLRNATLEVNDDCYKLHMSLTCDADHVDWSNSVPRQVTAKTLLWMFLVASPKSRKNRTDSGTLNMQR